MSREALLRAVSQVFKNKKASGFPDAFFDFL